MERLHQDYKEFIRLLEANKVDYLVVGAYALAFHGLPRYTGDIDFWINNSPDNSKKVFHSIKEFGFPVSDLSEEDFTSDDLIFQMGYPPVRIDVLTSISGLNFKDSYKKKKVKTSGNLKINFICIEDLKINKKSSGRKKDLADLEELNKLK